MKRVLLNVILINLVLGLGLFACGNDDDGGEDNGDDDTDTNPDAALIEDFEAYDVGTPISTVDGDLVWELWPDGIDGLVTDETAYKSEKSLEVYTDVDDVLMLNYTKGSYDIEFMMFIEKSMMGYYNFQATYKGGEEGNVWAFEVYMYAGGVGSLRVGTEPVADFLFKDNSWIKISHKIDLDNDTAEMFVDDVSIFSWVYSIPQGGKGNGTLDGIDFFGADDPPGTFYWLDDVKVFEN